MNTIVIVSLIEPGNTAHDQHKDPAGWSFTKVSDYFLPQANKTFSFVLIKTFVLKFT